MLQRKVPRKASIVVFAVVFFVAAFSIWSAFFAKNALPVVQPSAFENMSQVDWLLDNMYTSSVVSSTHHEGLNFRLKRSATEFTLYNSVQLSQLLGRYHEWTLQQGARNQTRAMQLAGSVTLSVEDAELYEMQLQKLHAFASHDIKSNKPLLYTCTGSVRHDCRSLRFSSDMTKVWFENFDCNRTDIVYSQGVFLKISVRKDSTDAQYKLVEWNVTRSDNEDAWSYIENISETSTHTSTDMSYRSKQVNATQTSESVTLDIMSFNIRHGVAHDGQNSWVHRKELVYHLINKNSIVGAQEALFFQVEEILAANPRFAYIGVGRNDGKRSGEHAAIFYDKSIYRVMDNGTFWFCNKPDVPGCRSYGNKMPRISTWGLFEHVASGKMFIMYNLHLDNRSEKVRKLSVEQLLRHVVNKASIHKQVPIFITGDFNNAGVNGEEVQMVKRAGFIDTFSHLYPSRHNEVSFHSYTGNKGPKIDFVFAPSTASLGGEVKVVSADIDFSNLSGRFPSDHFPVTSVVEI